MHSSNEQSRRSIRKQMRPQLSAIVLPHLKTVCLAKNNYQFLHVNANPIYKIKEKQIETFTDIHEERIARGSYADLCARKLRPIDARSRRGNAKFRKKDREMTFYLNRATSVCPLADGPDPFPSVKCVCHSAEMQLGRLPPSD